MKLGNLKRLSHEFMLNTSVNGLPNIGRTNNKFIFTLWIVCFLVCTIFCIYYSILSVFQYVEFQCVTSMDILNESPALFPTITICNLNGFKEELNISDMLLDCKFNNQHCNLSYFQSVFYNEYGNCLVFNNKLESKKYYSFLPGKYGALIVNLFIGTKTKEDPFGNGYGYHIFVHNTTKINQRILKGVDVSPGFQTNLVIDRIFYEKLPLPYENCFLDFETTPYFSKDLIKKVQDELKKYDQVSCFEFCQVKILDEKCNCKTNFGKLMCENSSYNQTCWLDIIQNFYAKYFIECLQDCPLECHSQEFTISTSFLEYPHISKVDYFANMPIIKSNFNKNITLGDLKKVVLSVAIYYQDLKYTIISKHPKTALLDLISDIGGVLGLFLGASFLSLMEIFELILKIAFNMH